MRQPSPGEIVGHWTSEHGFLVFLAFATIVGAVGFGIFATPVRPPDRLVGVVQDIAFGPQKSGLNRTAYVWLGGRMVPVTIDPNVCLVGDSIVLSRQHRLWGDFLDAGPLPCSRR